VNVLVIGSGGREHALVWKLAQSPKVSQLFCAPGNAGIETVAKCLHLSVDDIAGLRSFAVSKCIDLTVVGPEVPLALGIVDEFRKSKLKIFGPTRAAARIESSKAFAKELMVRHKIPTATAHSFISLPSAREYIDQQPLPIVIKADGLAQGKGVVVAGTREEAHRAAASMLQEGEFGEAGQRILVEEFLSGEEVTIMGFTDGKTVRLMPAAQDYKRIGDGNRGPNTGGMGAYAPVAAVNPSILQTVTREVFQRIIDALSRVGSPFQGVLYAGLMIVQNRPYVLEFNARLGDPETQVIMPLLKTDLVNVLEAVVAHRLDQIDIAWHTDTAVCVVLTSEGYPGTYTTGRTISGLERLSTHDIMVFHAGTKRDKGNIVTAGGRVLGVTGIAPMLFSARDKAYQAAKVISYEGSYFRSDIALEAMRNSAAGNP
jgi:phosphoribosylamine--glycine ligase